MQKISKRINKDNSKHLYELTVLTAHGMSQSWEVEANNRSQAGAIAKKNGAIEVCDCNMIG